jgi:hypothetical protein
MKQKRTQSKGVLSYKKKRTKAKNIVSTQKKRKHKRSNSKNSVSTQKKHRSNIRSNSKNRVSTQKKRKQKRSSSKRAKRKHSRRRVRGGATQEDDDDDYAEFVQQYNNPTSGSERPEQVQEQVQEQVSEEEEEENDINDIAIDEEAEEDARLAEFVQQYNNPTSGSERPEQVQEQVSEEEEDENESDEYESDDSDIISDYGESERPPLVDSTPLVSVSNEDQTKTLWQKLRGAVPGIVADTEVPRRGIYVDEEARERQLQIEQEKERQIERERERDRDINRELTTDELERKTDDFVERLGVEIPKIPKIPEKLNKDSKWIALVQTNGEIYYYNEDTKQTQWEQPTEGIYTQMDRSIYQKRETDITPELQSKFARFKSRFKGEEYEGYINRIGTDLRDLYISYTNEYFKDIEEGADSKKLKEKYYSFIGKYYEEAMKHDKKLIELLK